MIRDSRLQTHGDQLIVANNTYTLTPGLLDLLLKKDPDLSHISPQEWDTYQTIVTNTHTNRRGYHSNSAIRSSRMAKIMRMTKKGHGMLPHSMLVKRGHKTDYIFWDDPNELVERLQLLAASYQAGNRSHTYEIIAILEELRAADLIQ